MVESTDISEKLAAATFRVEDSYTLKMKAEGLTETSVRIYWSV
jgi:hypothetical protein